MGAADAIRVAIVGSMMLLVFAVGLRSKPADALYVLRRPLLLARSLLAMNLIYPVLVGLLVAAFAFRPAVEIGLIGLSVSPIPPFLPRKQLTLTRSAQFTIGLFVATALLAPLLVTGTMILIEMLGIVERHVPAGRVTWIVTATVLLPLAVGLLVRRSWPRVAGRIQPATRIVAAAMLVAALIPLLIVQWPSMWALLGDGTLLAIVVATLLGLAVGHAMGGPQPEDRSVLALATAARHPAVAVAVGAASFPEQQLMPAAVLLAVLMSFLASAPYVAWRKRVYRELRAASRRASLNRAH